MKLKSILCESSFAGKTYISVDIQPEYIKSFGFSIEDYTSFLNENHDHFGRLIFLYNGAESLGMVSEQDYKIWFFENGLEESVLEGAQFYDKGYAFFRYCMDNSIEDTAIANFVRFMYENDVRDSRDMTREMWAKYLREYRRLDRTEVYGLLKAADDCVNIPDLMDYLKKFRNIVLTGGGVNECLKEVEIALQALKIPYTVDSKFTY
jgi:hypothetical protein